MGEEKYLGEVLKKYGVQFTPDVKAHVYEKYIELAPDYVEAFAGVRELLQQLKNEGYRIAVASSADLIKVESNL
jgi:beta-phosphoglucomutase-like phosphatase (HAD superfamily)